MTNTFYQYDYTLISNEYYFSFSGKSRDNQTNSEPSRNNSEC